MRAIITAATFSLALALGGCGERDQPVAAINAAESPVNVANQLANLEPGQRDAVFIRAIRDAGEACQHVESSEPAGEYEGNPVWRAQCEGGASWTIVVTPSGTAQIINDAQARLVGLDEAGPQNEAATENRQAQ